MSGPQDPAERRFDLQMKRDSCALEKDKRTDTDIRIMRWILFGMGLVVFLGSLVGTVVDWTGASYILTAFVSAAFGHTVRIPIKLFPESPRAAGTRRQMAPPRRGERRLQ